MHVPLPVASQELSGILDLHGMTTNIEILLAVSEDLAFYFGLRFC